MVYLVGTATNAAIYCRFTIRLCLRRRCLVILDFQVKLLARSPLKKSFGLSESTKMTLSVMSQLLTSALLHVYLIVARVYND